MQTKQVYLRRRLALGVGAFTCGLFMGCTDSPQFTPLSTAATGGSGASKNSISKYTSLAEASAEKTPDSLPPLQDPSDLMRECGIEAPSAFELPTPGSGPLPPIPTQPVSGSPSEKEDLTDEQRQCMEKKICESLKENLARLKELTSTPDLDFLIKQFEKSYKEICENEGD